MPRPRLSYDQAKMKGATAINKGRFEDRKATPSTVGTVGNPPKHLTTEVKSAWREIAKSIPAGVAGKSDRLTVEMASRLLYQFRTEPNMQASRISLLMQLMSRLGLDPQARTRMHVETQPDKTPKDTDEWSTLQPATQTGQRNTRLM